MNTTNGLDSLLLSRFTYDPDSGAITSLRTGKTTGSHDKDGYLRSHYRASGRSSYISNHRFAFLAMTGRWPACHVDHINGVKDDNRWCNLRDVEVHTNKQNMLVATAHNRSSGLLGVTYDASDGHRAKPWKATITATVGRFSTPEEAHQAYLDAKRLLHSGCTI